MKHEGLTKDIIGAAMTVLNELRIGNGSSANFLTTDNTDGTDETLAFGRVILSFSFYIRVICEIRG